MICRVEIDNLLDQTFGVLGSHLGALIYNTSIFRRPSLVRDEDWPAIAITENLTVDLIGPVKAGRLQNLLGRSGRSEPAGFKKYRLIRITGCQGQVVQGREHKSALRKLLQLFEYLELVVQVQRTGGFV